MTDLRVDCTATGVVPLNRQLFCLTDCAFSYLDAYLHRATSAEKVEDPDRLEQISRFQEQFKEDIRTQDKAQGMIAKMIGADKARRIFYEVTT